MFPPAVWGGAKLADVLELLGVSKLTAMTKSGGKHVEFVSIDKCKVNKINAIASLLLCHPKNSVTMTT